MDDLPPMEPCDGAEPRDNRVVMDDQPSVRGRVDIQLHPVGAERHRGSKRVDGILRGMSRGSSVGEGSGRHDKMAECVVDMFAISR